MKNKIFTLILLVSPERSEILLGMKKRGFGVGKWNGFGGKVTPDESIFSGALRELKEEAGIYCPDLRFIGLISFEFKGEPDILYVHIFRGNKHEGIIEESEEMRPSWFKIGEIPYDLMWKDDMFWLPILLEEKCFVGYFLFEGHNTILKYNLNEVTKEELKEKQKELINFPLE